MKIGSGKITARWQTYRRTIRGGENILFIEKQTGVNAQIGNERAGKKGDSGYWQQVEVSINDHSQAKLSHGICPGDLECRLTFIFRKQLKKG